MDFLRRFWKVQNKLITACKTIVSHKISSESTSSALLPARLEWKLESSHQSNGMASDHHCCHTAEAGFTCSLQSSGSLAANRFLVRFPHGLSSPVWGSPQTSAALYSSDQKESHTRWELSFISSLKAIVNVPKLKTESHVHYDTY